MSERIAVYRATANSGTGRSVDGYGVTAEDAKQRAQGKMQYSPYVSIEEVAKFTMTLDDFLAVDEDTPDTLSGLIATGLADREVVEE